MLDGVRCGGGRPDRDDSRPHQRRQILVVFADRQHRDVEPARPAVTLGARGEDRLGDDRHSGHRPLEFEETALHVIPAGHQAQAAKPLPLHPAGRFARGNARETAGWMQRERFRSLCLVTSWYHMQRSLLEFQRAMPGMAIIAEPVFAARPEGDGWSGWLDIAMLTVSEYDKYLATLVRPGVVAIWPPAATSYAVQHS